jgi:tRNA G18 (ribose-2'-O)-methylase SpoU
LEPILRGRPEAVDVFIAEKKLLETLTGFSMYQGLLAVGQVPPQPRLESILERRDAPLLLAAVDALSSAENMGAVVRNCAGFGARALVVGETCSSPFLRRAVRSSMGTVFQLPILETGDLAGVLGRLRQAGVRCVAAHPHADGRGIATADLRGDSCVVFGSEGHGLSPQVLAACDEAVAIPMPPAVDSLNVASAAAVFLYEANRQRGAMGRAG